MDTANNFFVVQDQDNGKTITVKTWASVIPSLAQGARVRVTLPQAGNVALKIVKG